MKHIVFDLDGTLADTQKIHQRIEADFLHTYDIHILPERIGQLYAGRTPQERIFELTTKKNIDISQDEIAQFVDRKDTEVIRLLQSGAIELMPYTKELLVSLAQKGYKIGIASGACREFIDLFLEVYGLQSIIVATTSANEVLRKKPHPDVFVSVFEKIASQYGPCEEKYVIGDGRSDVLGGHAAGAKTCRLTYTSQSPEKSHLCDFSVHCLQDLEPILL